MTRAVFRTPKIWNLSRGTKSRHPLGRSSNKNANKGNLWSRERTSTGRRPPGDLPRSVSHRVALSFGYKFSNSTSRLCSMGSFLPDFFSGSRKKLPENRKNQKNRRQNDATEENFPGIQIFFFPIRVQLSIRHDFSPFFYSLVTIPSKVTVPFCFFMGGGSACLQIASAIFFKRSTRA